MNAEDTKPQRGIQSLDNTGQLLTALADAARPLSLGELARAFHQDGFLRRTFTITLPAAAPSILAGLRTGVGQAWMTLIAAELLGVPGMGQEMNAAAGVGAYDVVVVYMLVISAVYALCDGSFSVFEHWVLRWRPK